MNFTAGVWTLTLAGFAGLILLNWQQFQALAMAALGVLRGFIGVAG